jgi:hypothetical protein
LEQGDAVVFVGAPHVRGVSKLLRADGYQIEGPGLRLSQSETPDIQNNRIRE